MKRSTKVRIIGNLIALVLFVCLAKILGLLSCPRLLTYAVMGTSGLLAGVIIAIKASHE